MEHICTSDVTQCLIIPRVVVVGHDGFDGRCFEKGHLECELLNELRQLSVFLPALPDLLLCGILHTLAGQLLLGRLRKRLDPCLVGVWLDTLLAEPLQHNANLLFGSVLTSNRRSHPLHERPSLLAAV